MIFFFAEEKRERQFLQAYEVLQEVEAELEELAVLGGQDDHVEVATSESRHQLWWSAEGVELNSSLLYFQPSDGRFSGNEIWVSKYHHREELKEEHV